MLTDLLLTAESVGTELIELDKQWLLAVNGSDSLYLDRVAHVLTTALTWLPLYLSLFYIVVRNNENFRKVLCVLAGAGLCVLLAGSVDDLIVKPTVARWRPTHAAEFVHSIDTVYGYRGGRYGFVSSHAANTFAVAVFLWLLLRSKMVGLSLVAWAMISSYSRVYLGVHYPGDIFCGALLGIASGALVYAGFSYAERHLCGQKGRYGTVYTRGRFLTEDMNLLLFSLMGTYCCAIVGALILASQG